MNDLDGEARRLARISELLTRGSLGAATSRMPHGAVSSDSEKVRSLARSMRISELLDRGSLGGLAARVLQSTVADADVVAVRQTMIDIEASEQPPSDADAEVGGEYSALAVSSMWAEPNQVRMRRGPEHAGAGTPDRRPLYIQVGNAVAVTQAENFVAVAERGSLALRMVLGKRLRQLRERRGITKEVAAEAIRGSHGKISRLESGRTGFKERDLRDLLFLYGVDDPAEQATIFDLARRANEPGWWQQHSDLLPAWFATYMGLEQAATMIRTYQMGILPSLLQTADYARAVITLSSGSMGQTDIERKVAILTRRQQALTRTAAPTFWLVVDESVLHRRVGGTQVWREELEHLLEMAERPNIRIQVLPYSAGKLAPVANSFSILSFPEPELPNIVYTEQLTSAIYVDRPGDVESYETAMKRMVADALPTSESVQYLKQLLASAAVP
ncbi:helix-turn-helix domain-containing protein [Nocardia sp. NPDC003726]